MNLKLKGNKLTTGTHSKTYHIGVLRMNTHRHVYGFPLFSHGRCCVHLSMSINIDLHQHFSLLNSIYIYIYASLYIIDFHLNCILFLL